MRRFTIDEFRKTYPNDDACLDKIFQLRYKGLICPKCESDKPFVRVKNRRSYQCPNCAYQLYPTKDTIFEKTTTPLIYWFYAIYLQTTTRNGVAAKELERQLNICYTTALRMAHQIKRLMANYKNMDKLTGTVQVDETYLGMKISNKHNKQRAEFRERGMIWNENKTGVMGFINESKQLRLEVMDDLKSFMERVRENVDSKAIVVTDSHAAYSGLSIEYFKHQIVNHFNNEYVKDGYHTNTIENAWSQLKRTIKGTHIHVSPKYLQLYVDEVAFRMMNAKKQDVMFETILSHVA